MVSLSQKLDMHYSRERRFDALLGRQHMRVISRPGFPDWERVTQAMRLISGKSIIAPAETLLVCPCGHGALGVWAASQGEPGNIALCDTNCVAAEMATRTLEANGLGDTRVRVGLPSSDDTAYDVVLMVLPKGRHFARLLLLDVHRALRIGGRLYLAGPNKGGIKSVIRDGATLFGSVEVLAYKGGNRVALLRKTRDLAEADLPEAYREPGLSKDTFRRFDIEVRGEHYAVCTRPGVFSWRRLDAGTALLLDVLQVNVDDVVLDIGCGYGIIGMHAARHAIKGRTIMVDVDWLACECARASLALNGLEAEVLLGDGLAAVAGRRFTLVVSNPPFHSGHQVDLDVVEAFVQGAYAALEAHGRLVIVANRFLPYNRLIAQSFGSCETLLQTPQYHVLGAEKGRSRRPSSTRESEMLS